MRCNLNRPAEVILDEVDAALSKLDGREKLKSARKSGFGDQVSIVICFNTY